MRGREIRYESYIQILSSSVQLHQVNLRRIHTLSFALDAFIDFNFNIKEINVKQKRLVTRRHYLVAYREN